MMKKNWFRPKSYIHFDYRIFENDRGRVEKFVRDPKSVAKHAFYPFIQYSKKKYKIRDSGNGKVFLDKSGQRLISYSAHLDSQIYGFYSDILGKAYESTLKKERLETCVVAFRSLKDEISGDGKCNIHLAKDAFEAVKALGNCTVYALDIEQFFDSLEAKTLKKMWAEVLGEQTLPEDHYNIFKSVSKFSYVSREAICEALDIPKSGQKKLTRYCSPKEFREKIRGSKRVKRSASGIPQGSPISANLANIYMLGFDREIARVLRSFGGSYYRYCDDIMCILPSEAHVDLVKTVSVELERISLKLNIKKTQISSFRIDTDSKLNCDKPIQYLGFVFDGRAVSLRAGSISKFRREFSAAMRLAIATRKKCNAERVRKGKQPEVALYVKNIFRRYFYSGRRNFLSYAIRAKKILGSSTIKQQAKKMNSYVTMEIDRVRR
jgi:RNA-directed DNA polymerase